MIPKPPTPRSHRGNGYRSDHPGQPHHCPERLGVWLTKKRNFGGECLLSGVKRKSISGDWTSESSHIRTFAVQHLTPQFAPRYRWSGAVQRTKNGRYFGSYLPVSDDDTEHFLKMPVHGMFMLG